MSTTQTVLFVCLHGAGMSRMAAAYFNRLAPPDWRALSAGIDPAERLSSTAASLLAGTGADEFLDQSPPRTIAAVPDAQRVIALRNPAIRYELAPAEFWDLSQSAGVPLREEIRQRVEALARSIDAS
jgi:protein-tyrosine-phosphatase